MMPGQQSEGHIIGGSGSIEHLQEVNNVEEDDYEDMVTPTDDEGITNLNHT